MQATLHTGSGVVHLDLAEIDQVFGGLVDDIGLGGVLRAVASTVIGHRTLLCSIDQEYVKSLFS